MAQKNNSGSNTTGNVLTDFIAGCRQGVNTNFFVQIPNFIFAFVLIQILNVSGLMDLINTALPDDGIAVARYGDIRTAGLCRSNSCHRVAVNFGRYWGHGFPV